MLPIRNIGFDNFIGMTGSVSVKTTWRLGDEVPEDIFAQEDFKLSCMESSELDKLIDEMESDLKQEFVSDSFKPTA